MNVKWRHYVLQVQYKSIASCILAKSKQKWLSSNGEWIIKRNYSLIFFQIMSLYIIKIRMNDIDVAH